MDSSRAPSSPTSRPRAFCRLRPLPAPSSARAVAAPPRRGRPAPLGATTRTRWMACVRPVDHRRGPRRRRPCRLVALLAVEGTPHPAVDLCLTAIPLAIVGACALSRCYEPRFLPRTGRLPPAARRRAAHAVVGVIALVSEGSSRAHRRHRHVPGLHRRRAARALGRPPRVEAGARPRRRRCTARRRHRARDRREMMRPHSTRDDHRSRSSALFVDPQPVKDVIEGSKSLGTCPPTSVAPRLHDADTLIVAAWSTFSQQELRHLSWARTARVDVLVSEPSPTSPAAHLGAPPVGLPLHVEGAPISAAAVAIDQSLFDRVMALFAIPVSSAAARLSRSRCASTRAARRSSQTHGRNGRTFRMVSSASSARQRRPDARRAACQERAPACLRDGTTRALARQLASPPLLDELPQLFNVLTGSHVARRPRAAVRRGRGTGDDVHRRPLVEAGMTGLWQRRRPVRPREGRSVSDLYHVENWSFLATSRSSARPSARSSRPRRLLTAQPRPPRSASRRAPASPATSAPLVRATRSPPR